MKQSSKKNYTNDTAALLLRISRDDGEDGESNSIQNQKQLLTKLAKEYGYTNILIYTDDGITGTTMNRPGFQAMIRDIERGKIQAVFVKDDCVIIEPTQKDLENQGFVAGSICF